MALYDRHVLHDCIVDLHACSCTDSYWIALVFDWQHYYYAMYGTTSTSDRPPHTSCMIPNRSWHAVPGPVYCMQGSAS